MRRILSLRFLRPIMTWCLDIVVLLNGPSLNELTTYLNRWEYLYSVFSIRPYPVIKQIYYSLRKEILGRIHHTNYTYNAPLYMMKLAVSAVLVKSLSITQSVNNATSSSFFFQFHF
jgi:hypothetical protein